MENIAIKKMSFDSYGNLTPYKIIRISQLEIKLNFVDQIPTSTTRSLIYNGYRNYYRDLSLVVNKPFSQLIDGSFTTVKDNPNDIDLVNVLHIDIANSLNTKLYPFLTRKGDPKLQYLVDGYLLPIYDISDIRYSFLDRHYIYWINQFGKDRNGLPKGIVETMVALNDK